MSEERMMNLNMLSEGKISAEEAARLLESLEKGGTSSESEPEPARGQGKFFRVTIIDSHSGKVRTNIRIPLNVMDIGAKFGAHFAPQMEGIENEELMRAVRSGEVGKIIDVFDDEDGEHVEIYIE